MSVLSNAIKLVILVFNALCVAAMVACVYSSYLPPQYHPRWSVLGLLFPAFLCANILFALFWLLFKWKYAALSLLGLLLCFGKARAYLPVNFSEKVPDSAIKIMTYNVGLFGHMDGHTWEDNPVLELILNSDADIVCLQEIGGFGAAINRKQLKQDVYPYVMMDKGMACLSKYPILSKKQIEYTSQGNNSFAYELCVEQDTVLLVNNHLESYKLSRADKDLYKDVLTNPQNAEDNSDFKNLIRRLMRSNKARGAQVDSVKTFLDANAPSYRHVIVCGDFNETPVSYSYNQLTENLNDAFASSGSGLGFTYSRNGMFFRLDHIMVSDAAKVHDAYVDHSTDASDHYPMCAVIELK